MSTATAPATRPSRARIIADLQALLGDAGLLHLPEDLHPYECDGLSAYRQLPLAVALPETVEQVRAVLGYASRHALPVVARGAGTGLSGG
ncbi:MAG: FAD-binding oxidoreductase, partial [Gammaproteobacteria bacterium]|nr:FAD-binding oxidoreductase [Gammaproteobacteria bacterium]